MFLVLVMGAAVTNTGSAEGCGRSWPLCNGQLVPEFTVSTAIEYSHRAVTGVVGLLVVALTALMLGLWRRDGEPIVPGPRRPDREPLVLALVMLGTLLLQAGLGAGAVLWPQSPLMLATHFGVSLVAFTATFLSAVVVFERTSALEGVPTQARIVRNWAIAVGAYLLGVVYLGAYVRHAGVSLACPDWPLCEGRLVPPLSGAIGVVFAHRLAAVGAVLLLAWLARLALRDGVAERAALLAVGLAVLQALSGALVVWTRLGLFSTLAHAGLVALLFACLMYVARRAAGLSKRNGFVAEVFSPSDETARGLRRTTTVSFPHAVPATDALAASELRSSSGSGSAADLPGPVAGDDDGERQRAGAGRVWPGPGRGRRHAGSAEPRRES